MNEDSEHLKIIGSTIVRSMWVICIAVVCCFTLSNCSLNAEVIKNCETSCDAFGGRMEYVTHSKCQCTDKQLLSTSPPESIWVLPRK